MQSIPSYIANADIESLALSVRAKGALRALSISKVHEIIDFSINEILNVRNCGRKTANEILSFLAAHDIEHEKPYEIIEVEKSWFGSDLLNELQLFESRIKNIDVYEQRVKNKLATLQQLGDANNLSKERIRQIENNIVSGISLFMQKYSNFFFGVIEKYGDFVSFDVPEVADLKEYIQLLDNMFIVLDWNISVDADRCVMYKRNIFDNQILENYPQSGTFEDIYGFVCSALELYVRNETPEQKYNFNFFAKYFTEKTISDNYEQIDDQYFLNEYVFKNKITKRAAKIALLFRKYFPNGTNIYQEVSVYEKLSKEIPELTQRALRGQLSRNRALLLMKSGHYIHKGSLTYDSKAVDFALKKCRELLNSVPKIFIGSLFKPDKDYYIKSGIEEPYLLYSLLRMHNHDELAFKYMYIMKKANHITDNKNKVNEHFVEGA